MRNVDNESNNVISPHFLSPVFMSVSALVRLVRLLLLCYGLSPMVFVSWLLIRVGNGVFGTIMMVDQKTTLGQELGSKLQYD